MEELIKVLDYLKERELILTTAESCTAGRIIHLLAKIAGSGACLDAGYVVYLKSSKQRLLGVKQSTIDSFTLTSEEVAREMVEGALHESPASVSVSTTGIAGPEPMDGIPPGTVCFGWGFKTSVGVILYSETQHFNGERDQILTRAAEYALIKIPLFHQLLLRENPTIKRGDF